MSSENPNQQPEHNDEQPFLVRSPSRAWVAVVTWEAAAAELSKRSKQEYPSLEERIDTALAAMDDAGYGLVDIRLASASSGEWVTQQTVVLVGRTLDPTNSDED